jgi:hypothetical protein
MKGMRLVLVAAVICLAVLSPLAAPAYACGGSNQYPCSNRPATTYQYQYTNPYPYRSANPYPYAYRYPNQYVYPYAYQYQNQYIAPAPPPPPPNPPVYYYAPNPPVYYYAPNPPVYYAPSPATGYGDYTRCAQYRLHQSSCFVPNAANSPNLGSIQMEPGIQIWGSCSSGQTMSQSGTTYQCSKTGAGWFPQ